MDGSTSQLIQAVDSGLLKLCSVTTATLEQIPASAVPLPSGEQPGQDLASFALNHVSERTCVEGRFRADIDRARTPAACPVNEVGGRIDRTGSADDEHHVDAIDLAQDSVHLERDLAEEDDVRPKESAALATWDFAEAAVDGSIEDRWAPAIFFAAGFGKFAVHVDEAARAGTLMKVVHVLGAEEEAVAKSGFQLSEFEVSRVGLGLLRRCTAHRVELPHERGVAPKGLWRAHVFEAMPFPQTVRGAERGQAAFRADSGSCEHEEAVVSCERNGAHMSTVDDAVAR